MVALIVDPVPFRSRLLPGWTLTQHERGTQMTPAVRTLLGRSAAVVNQHLLGFGTSADPAPSGGPPYDFSSLDRRLGATQAEGWLSDVEPGGGCLTLCGCPPAMRVPRRAGDWSWPLGEPDARHLTDPFTPQPPHVDRFGDFAELCAAAADRYRHVTWFQVWNELKRFHSPALGRWWYEGYTELYDTVHAAIRRVRPDARIIGPYVVVRTYGDPHDRRGSAEISGPWGCVDAGVLDVLRHWAEHSREADGADALGIDLRNSNWDTPPSRAATGPGGDRGRGAGGDRGAGAGVPWWPVDAWSSADKLPAIRAWLDAQGGRLAELPLWLCEWYANPPEGPFEPGDPHVAAPDVALSVVGWNLLAAIEAGVSGLLMWRPSGEGPDARARPLGLWRADDGAPTALADLLAGVRAHAAAGSTLRRCASADGVVRGVLADQAAVLVSRSPQVVDVELQVDGASPTRWRLAPHGAQVVPLSP